MHSRNFTGRPLRRTERFPRRARPERFAELVERFAVLGRLKRPERAERFRRPKCLENCRWNVLRILLVLERPQCALERFIIFTRFAWPESALSMSRARVRPARPGRFGCFSRTVSMVWVT